MNKPRSATVRKPSAAAAASPLGRHELYEICAQAPARDARVLAAMHGRRPRVLGEDFCGTAALSRAWASLSPRHRAVGVDHDAATLAVAGPHPRVKLVRADVRRARDKADLIAVLNFSICEIHDRRSLVKYLRHARSRLNARGAFVCDIYGGTDCMLTGTISQRFTGPGAERVEYLWEQRTADPLTGRVVNAMHFSVRKAGAKPAALHDAFVYDWRLWSVPELREAMREAGFAATDVFERRPGAIDQRGEFHIVPIEDPTEIGDSFSVYVVGRR